MTLKMEYELKGRVLPEKYEADPPIYTDAAAATAWSAEGARSSTVSTTATLTA